MQLRSVSHAPLRRNLLVLSPTWGPPTPRPEVDSVSRPWQSRSFKVRLNRIWTSDKAQRKHVLRVSLERKDPWYRFWGPRLCSIYNRHVSSPLSRLPPPFSLRPPWNNHRGGLEEPKDYELGMTHPTLETLPFDFDQYSKRRCKEKGWRAAHHFLWSLWKSPLDLSSRPFLPFSFKGILEESKANSGI